MSVDDDEKELRDLCQRLQDRKRTSKGGGEQGAPEEDDVRSNGRRDDVRDVEGANAEDQAILQIPQPQPQGATVCWERFLHIRSLKVLIVEYDDSTRHVVAALLRNCSYEVIEAANGLQAWKILEDLNNHIDLVLTEVAMPCLSGIGLLYKIVSHKTRKNIPVIMMSSHDSMGLVFKCLSKGAVDFLVKPIRKNELKNLWQHVWRRCHSSSGSGSGSESGTETQKSVKSKSLVKFENNSGSNDEDEDQSTGLNVGDGSDIGSGTQSSCTKQAVEVDSPRAASAWDLVPECPDSTCAQVVHSIAEISGKIVLPVATIKDCQDQREQLEVKTGVRKDLDLLECRNDIPVRNAVAKHGGLVEMGSSKLNESTNREELDISCEHVSSSLRSKGTLMGGSTTNSKQQLLRGELEAPNRLCEVSNVDNKPSNMDEGLSLELSLKRLRGVKDFGTTAQEDRNVLRRSDLSAFSRYNAASSKSLAVCVGSNSPHCDSSRDMQSHSSGNHLNQNSNGASNNIDMSSITNNAYTKMAVVGEQLLASTGKGLYPTSAFQVVKNNSLSSTQQVVSCSTNDILAIAPIKGGLQRDDPPQKFHHQFDSHLHFPNNVQKTEHPGDNDVPLKNTSAAPNCGSSNALEVVDGNVGYSVNGSATGSNNGSNGQNGSSTALNAGGTNMESDNRVAGNSGSGSANRGDQNKTSHREVALNKFRQKRKERCFRKKVRYQSRKRLAEQRPRFRGQFVRQSPTESESKTSDS